MRLRDSLSNPSKELTRLLTALADPSRQVDPQVKACLVWAIVEQTGAVDLLSVRMEVNENRKLSPAEVDEMVQAYEAGVSMLELGRRFCVHDQTVRRQLVKQGCKSGRSRRSASSKS